MKTKLSLALVMLFAAASFMQAQSKSEIEESLATCTAEKESIQKELTSVSATYDSLNTTYTVMYDAIKEKVFKDDFDPSKMSELIDSLHANASSGNTELNDSLSSLKKENAALKDLVGADKSKVVSDLKQLKELLDEGILTQEEYDRKKTVLIEKL